MNKIIDTEGDLFAISPTFFARRETGRERAFEGDALRHCEGP